MQLADMIAKRKSTRQFTGVPVEKETIDKIEAFVSGMKPLYADIRVQGRMMERSQVRCLCPWTTPQVMAIYSEEKEGWLENAGFLFQQLDLYLHTLGLGVCWLGMGRLRDKEQARTQDGLRYVIMLAFGHPSASPLRTGEAQFRRRALAEISDRADERLEPARLAPSSVNSQPWYFTHEDDAIHAFCVQKGLGKAMGDMNRIDMGIALAHLYVTNPESFRFFRAQPAQAPRGYGYIGSFSL